VHSRLLPVALSVTVAAGFLAGAVAPEAKATAPSCTKGIATPANSRITTTAVTIGGTEYCIEHIFQGGANQIWNVPGGVTSVDVYVIGAGAAGSRYGGGGGGGAVEGQNGIAVGSATTATVTVGGAQEQSDSRSYAESSSITLNGTSVSARGGYSGGLSSGGTGGATGSRHGGGESATKVGSTVTRPATAWADRLAGGGGGGASTSGGAGEGRNAAFGSLDKAGDGGEGLDLSAWLGGSYTPDPSKPGLVYFGCGGGGGIYNDQEDWDDTQAGAAGCNDLGRGYRAIDGTLQAGNAGFGTNLGATGGFGRGGGGGFCSTSGCDTEPKYLGYSGDNGGVLIRWEAAVPQTITVDSNPFNGLGSTPYRKSTYTFAATASSGLAVAYSSADADVCTVGASTGVVELVGQGTCTIQMDQGGGVVGDTTFAPAPQVTSSVTVTGVSISASNPGDVEVTTREYDGTTSATVDTSAVT